MAESRFVYVTYIRATPQAVWDELTDPERNKLFWSGYHQETSWKVGDDYEVVGPDGRAWDVGRVLACDPPKRLEVSWLHQHDAAMRAEGESICTFELEPVSPEVTRVTLTHAIDRANSKLIGAVSNGWPSILASLKSLIETGHALA
jgi:uncharacterized protein YndB with AHSA1/START domain